MAEKIVIPIPASQFPTKIEVYYKGELNRSGGVQAGTLEAELRLPASVSECEIRIIPCNQQGQPVGRGFLYKDSHIIPETPLNIRSKYEKSSHNQESECEGICNEQDESIPTVEASNDSKESKFDEPIDSSDEEWDK